MRTVPQISPAVVACELYLPAGEVQTFGWGLLFCLILCTPNFDRFRPLRHLKVEVYSVKALVRWATGKRLTNRLPTLSLITLPPL